VQRPFADVLAMADRAAALSSLDNADYLNFVCGLPLPAWNRLIGLLNAQKQDKFCTFQP
jgi:hypothetical protein